MQKIKHRIKTAASTPRGRIWLLVILLVIVAAIGGGIMYWNYNKKSLIRNKLESTVNEKSEGLYNLKYGDLQIDEVGGNLTIKDLNMNYDSSRYLSLKNNDEAPSALLKIHIPSIEITGVKTPRALMSNEIVGKNLLIDSPVIEIYYTYSGKDSSRNIPTSEVYKEILGNLNMIKMDTVTMKDATIVTKSLRTGKSIIKLEKSTIQLVNLAIDSTSSLDSTRLLFSKEMNMDIQKISWSSGNKLYNYSIDNLSLNSVASEVKIAHFAIDPTLGESAFVKSLPAQDDRFDFSFKGIQISNLNFHALLNEKLIADNMQIDNSSFKIYRDLSIPRDNKNRTGKYPHQLFAKIPMDINIRKLVLASCFVEYKEKNPRSEQAGKVQFHQTHAVFQNVNNHPGKSNNIMTAEVNTSFLNKAPLNVNWKFYMNGTGRFDIKGKLGAMVASEVNPISEPMGPARLEDGKIQSFEFNLKGSNNNINGTVLFLYEDLKISLLEKDKGEKELDRKGVTSLFANIMIKDDNPTRKNEPRRIQVDLARDPNRSIFYLIWKGMFKGIQETVGIKKK